MIVLFAGLLVVLAMRGCEDNGGGAVARATPAPVVDAQHAFARLGDRDGIGVWPQRAIDLGARGYERLPEVGAPREVPFTAETTALDGLCGVVQVVPEETSRVEAARLGALTLRPAVPEGLASFAGCGAAEVAATSGTGQAALTTWVMPGLTPADVAASELPAEVALGLAEAEHALRADGWRATDRAIRAELAAGTTRWDPPRPATGCVAWAVVGLGFDRLVATQGGHAIHEDGRAGRQLVGALSCHDGGVITATDVDGDGGTLWALPFARGGGPRVAAPGAGLTTIGAVRLTTARELVLPAP